MPKVNDRNLLDEEMKALSGKDGTKFRLKELGNRTDIGRNVLREMVQIEFGCFIRILREHHAPVSYTNLITALCQYLRAVNLSKSPDASIYLVCQSKHSFQYFTELRVVILNE